jgi:hypothetical protein
VLHHCDNPPCVNPAHLRLGTNDENMADMKARGRSRNGQKKGTHNPHARIDEATVHEIRRLRMEGMTYRGIQAQLGLSNGCVSGVILGTRWAHVPSAKGGAAEQE